MFQSSSQFRRTLPWLLCLTALALFLAAFVVQVQRNPLRGDEVDFLLCMENVDALGRPLYYAGEINIPVASIESLGSDTLAGQAFQFYRYKPETGILKETFFAITDDNSRYTYCLWHPPLYVYLGALVLRGFELPHAQANLFRYSHLIYVAFMFGGLAMLLRELYRPVWSYALPLTTVFLACSGLAVAASTLVDYNGALAMCVVVWLAWAFLRADREPRHAPLAAVLLAFTFGVGLGIAASTLLGLLLWTVCFHRSALIRHAITFLAGATLFLIVFWLSAQAAHFPFSQPFLHNFQRAALQTPLSSRLVATFRHLGWYAEEIGLIAVGAGLLLCVWRFLSDRSVPVTAGAADVLGFASCARVFLLPTLVLVALFSQAALSADAYGFPKYIAFALPLLFAFLGGELVRHTAQPRSRWFAAATALSVLLSLGVKTGDMLRNPSGTLYMAGEQGFFAAAKVVAALTGPDEVILVSKDLAFYSDRRFIQWSGSLLQNPTLLQQRIVTEQVHLAAVSQNQLASASPEVAQWLAEHAVIAASPGDFRVYRLR